MTIREAAFRLFDKVKNSPNREEIRQVVQKLKSDERGYGNKIYPSPFLGLLLWNQDYIKKFEGKSPIESLDLWDERELKILFGVHNQLVNFNRLSANPLEAELPHSVFAVDPLPYKRYYHEELTEGFEELLFSKEDAEEMAQVFSTHPAFEMALRNLSHIKQNPLQIKTEQAVMQFITELTEAGVGGNAKWVEQLKQDEELSHPSSIFQRHIAALVCLNNSLANINQLIYQAVFQDNLSYLNKGDIIDYLIKSTNSGLGMSVTYLPNIDLFLATPSDLILVSVSSDFDNQLCCIYGKFGFQEFFRHSNINLRVIDDNMCSYGWLVSQ
jgi:hypothetical protein